MSDIVHVWEDDWAGLYVDGVLKHEGHSIRDEDWLELLNGRQVNLEDVKPGWLEGQGRLPLLLSEIPGES